MGLEVETQQTLKVRMLKMCHPILIFCLGGRALDAYRSFVLSFFAKLFFGDMITKPTALPTILSSSIWGGHVRY
jgi:hypothetical protein